MAEENVKETTQAEECINNPSMEIDENINDKGGIDYIPDEILEYILKLVSPYQDFRSCSRVNRRWRWLCEKACKSKLLAFHNQISEGELLWKGVLTEQSPDNISRRHSHSAVYNDKYLSMFIFGGCTASSSTFNDLLQFDLSNRTWNRPRAIGSYPSPKALATLVTNDDILILFGGWTHPSIYPLHQTWKLFSELHTFNIAESKWTQIKCDERDAWPPQTAGHSATLHGDKMVIFGGLTMQRGSENLSFQCSSNLWVLNLTSMTWYLQPTAGQLTPSGRYGQSQIYLDDSHLLILGGWLGTSNTDLTDVWLLQMDHTSGDWWWHELKVEGVEHRPKDISRHPAARAAKDRVVVLAKSKIAAKKPQSTKSRPTMIVRNAIGAIPSSSRGHHHHTSSSSEESDQVEPRRSRAMPSHQHQGSAEPQPGGSGHQQGGASAQHPVAGPSTSGGAWLHQHQDREGFGGVPKSAKQRMLENRQRQLASLNRMEEKLNRLDQSSMNRVPGGAGISQHNAAPSIPNSPSPVCPNHRMMMNILDTSRAITEHTVKWLPPNPKLPGVDVPQEVDLYSLVQGRTELILFGGLKRDISIRGAPPNHSTRDSSSVTNNLHILYPQIQNI